MTVLSIGVGSFDDGSDVEDLGFVPARVDEVAKAFERLGATVDPRLDPTEREIEALLRERLVDEPGPADVFVVHLIGHGKVDRDHRLSFIARDDREVYVDPWIARAQREVERAGPGRRVVFLVDTCSAGAATGRQPFTELDADRGVWALGACVSDSPTEQGKFSSWVATALHRLADRDFNLDDEAIAFEQFVHELLRVGRGEPARRRLSLGFNVEQGDADWPFLPNPRTTSLTAEEIHLRRRSLGYVPGEGDLGDQGGAGQHGDDARYFADRASGRGLVPTDTSVGFFSGRTAELRHYAEWLSGTGRLLTVTGAAGAGKSGLLGVIVCAADPQLRRRFRELWEPAEVDLPEVPDVVAVHARQRSAQQVVEAIARMAGLSGPVGAGRGRETSRGHRWTVSTLRAALEHEQKQRLIVLDAVDESTEPQAVLRLVADLLAPGRKNGETVPAPCRMLLGGRREVVNALSALEEAVDIASDHIDLDTAKRLTVEQDVRHYIQRMLTAREPYATGAPSEFVGLLAKKGAQHIVRGPRSHAPWGPFLLAGLYVHYLLTLKHPPQDEVGADAYAKSASADLPALLESILKTRRHDFPCLRAVLAVLARARGEGMPRTVLRRCVKTLHGDDIEGDHFQDTLWEASPFLRYGTDPQSGETLYRLFHQGLADYLFRHPVSEDPLDEAESFDLEGRLLSQIVGPFVSGTDDDTDPWEAAEEEPYVLRHALGHAARTGSASHGESLLTDPYFLIHFDLREDHRAMDLVRSEPARECLQLLSASWATHARLSTASDRASVFAFDAHRLGFHELAESFTRIARQVAVRPEAAAQGLLWSEGGETDSSTRFIESGSNMVHGLSFSPDGALLAAATHSGVQVLETETWRRITPAFGAGASWVTSVAFSPDGRLLAFGVNTLAQSVQLWDVKNRVLAGPPWHAWTGTPRALAFSPDSRWLAVGSEAHGVSVWDVTEGRPVEQARRGPGRGVDDIGDVRDVAFSPDGLLAVCGSAGVTVWEPEQDQWSPLTGERADAVAFSPDGRLLAVGARSGVTLHTVEDRTAKDRIRVNGGVDGRLAFTPDGSLLVVGNWSSLHVVDTESARVINRLPVSGGRISDIAAHPTSPVLVSGDSNGQLRLWTDVTQQPETPELPQFEAAGVAASPTGRCIAAYDQRSRLLTLRDPATGEAFASRSLRDGVSHLVFSPDGGTLAAMTEGFAHLHLYRISSPPLADPEIIRLNSWMGSRVAPVFSGDSRLIGVALEEQSDRYALGIWDATTLRLCARVPLAGHPRSFGFIGPDRIFAVVNDAMATYGFVAPGPEASA
ncbi:hypothetical protein ACGFNV_19440 [Streptomyces sp. NPDC048751]|uniref:hypothetical protein n=1 Tax=Streptomyces sp. NPDC048751 TaxID=3365591 RepID=UPI00371D9131